MELFLDLAPSVGTIVGVVAALFVLDRLLKRGPAAVAGNAFRNQLIMLGLTLFGGLIVILVVPIASETRGQLLSLIGILLTAAIALASTTFLGNAMAGIMLKSVESFRMGDFIRIGEHFGRVCERGLFHTEV